MYVNINKLDEALHIYAEEDDLCYLCANTEICPLLAALREEAVVLRYEFVGVGSCDMYREFTLSEMIAF
ncbi:MAG TPA: hypothetical protein DDW90_00765 [Cyanobacteria bacterium UBA9971]|nr:hypothetical protein [Cyanobacteria bacterium UBA9971]